MSKRIKSVSEHIGTGFLVSVRAVLQKREVHEDQLKYLKLKEKQGLKCLETFLWLMSICIFDGLS